MEFVKKVKTQKNVCIHSKNLISLIDLTNKDEAYSFYYNHLNNCKLCQNEFEKITQKILAMQVYIPKPIMEKDLKETFEREMHDFLVLNKLNENVVKKEKITKKLVYLNDFTLDLIKSFFSKTFIFGMALAGVSYLIISHYKH